MLSFNNSISNINSQLYYLKAVNMSPAALWQATAIRHDAFFILSLMCLEGLPVLCTLGSRPVRKPDFPMRVSGQPVQRQANSSVAL